MLCETCFSENVAKATVGVTLSSDDAASIKFFTNNKLALIACKDCRNVHWEVVSE